MYKKLLVSVLLTTALVAGCGPKSEDKQATNGDQIDTVMPLQDQGSAPATSSENGNTVPNANVAEPTQVPPASMTPDVKTPTTATTPAAGSDAKNPASEAKSPTDKMDASKVDPNGATKGQNPLPQDVNQALNKGLNAAGSGDASTTTKGDK